MQKSAETDDDQEWIERVGKTVYDLATNRRMSQEHEDLIIKSSDLSLLGCIESAIEQHIEVMSSNLRPTFQQILDDIKARKEVLERL